MSVWSCSCHDRSASLHCRPGIWDQQCARPLPSLRLAKASTMQYSTATWCTGCHAQHHAQDAWPERLRSEEEAATPEVATALGPRERHMQEEGAAKISDSTSPLPWPLAINNEASGCAEPAR